MFLFVLWWPEWFLTLSLDLIWVCTVQTHKAPSPGAHHWRQLCQAPWMHLQFWPANLSMLQLPAGAGLCLPALSTDRAQSAHIIRKHQAHVTCEFSGIKNIFSSAAIPTWKYPHCRAVLGTRCEDTKAVFSGTQHSAVMSCKCRILSNITIAIEGPWRAPASELGSAQIHWITLRKFQFLTSQTCT